MIKETRVCQLRCSRCSALIEEWIVDKKGKKTFLKKKDYKPIFRMMYGKDEELLAYDCVCIPCQGYISRCVKKLGIVSRILGGKKKSTTAKKAKKNGKG